MVYLVGKQVMLYDWPSSQECLECEHGHGVVVVSKTDLFGTMPALCMNNCQKPPSGTCPGFEETKARPGSFKNAELLVGDEADPDFVDFDDDEGFDLGGFMDDDGEGIIENDDHNGV